VLIVSFDGLRPDMVTPALMPNLTAFATEGVRGTHSRATFPTETRVNQAALVTGCYPTRHGIVGNKFLEPVASPGKLFNTGDETQLADGDRKLKGKLVDVPVLGEILAEPGMRLAVLSAGTPGGTRMLHHKAETLGGLRLALHRPDASVQP
jgi:predicted AlkP superfamily pyrophosphatase or phosphodiesterase